MKFQFVDSTNVLEKLSGKLSLSRNLMLTYYQPIVKKEVDLCQAQAGDEILCVGGGYFPCTAILFQQLSGAMVTVIDKDEQAVAYAKDLVQSLGYGDKVKVLHVDGLDSVASNFDIVHIAMQVSPKEAVFAQLKGTMKVDAKILIRTPKDHLQRGYQPFQGFSKEWVKQPFFSNIGKTLLYVR